MRLTTGQKLVALAGGVRRAGRIRDLLVRRFWQGKKEWTMDFEGVRARFDTSDFYSNYWFYGPKNVIDAHEPPVTSLMIKAARKATGFMDIGANLGYFSVVCGCARPGIRVLSLELDETLAPIVRRNLALNGIENAEAVFGAVGAGEGEIAYTPHPYSFLCKAAQEETEMPEIKLRAPVLEIDAVIAARDFRPDLVKMDVDGAEAAALSRAGAMLANPDLVMFFEVHPRYLQRFGSSVEEVERLLDPYGFSFYQIPDFRGGGAAGLKKLPRLTAISQDSNPMLLVTRRDPSFLDAE